MLNNLKAELIRKNIIPYKGIMQVLNCSEKTARNKIKGVTPITVPEAVKIIQTLFLNDNFSIEYLFSTDDKTA